MQTSLPNPPQSQIDFQQPHQSSLFLLKKTSSHSKKIAVHFDFVGSLENGPSSNWSVSDYLPTFNTDKKFYTPTFILKMDKARYDIRDQIYFSLHRDRVQSNLEEETSKLWVAKPLQFHNFCLVCKREYHDYQKHINSQQHYKKMMSSQFCKDIDDLCSRFGKKLESHQQKKKKIAPKTKKIKKIEKQVKWIQNVETKCEFEMVY